MGNAEHTNKFPWWEVGVA